MTKKTSIFQVCFFSFLVFWFMCAITIAGDVQKQDRNNSIAEEMKGVYGISWAPNVDYKLMTLCISKPGGDVISKTFDFSTVPGFNLSGTFSEQFQDGLYTYELRVTPVSNDFSTSQQTQTGYFRVMEGRIVIEKKQEITPDRTFCDCDEIAADLVVEGSLCAGHDCQYTGDCHVETLRLKEEDVRILFQDTSTSLYPDNDWKIVINDDDATGSGEYFSIQDVDGSTTPFTIEAGAPDNSLYVDSAGLIGVGTSTPNFEIEIFGKAAPKCEIVLHEPQGASSYFNATDSFGNVGTSTNHPFRLIANARWRMRINTDDTLTMIDGGSYNGTWNDASSREYKENIQALTFDEAITTLSDLNPVKFNYKIHKEEERLGFIAEDVPELVAFKDRKVVSAMDIVAVLTKVVQKQQETTQQLQETITELKKEIENLKK